MVSKGAWLVDKADRGSTEMLKGGIAEAMCFGLNLEKMLRPAENCFIRCSVHRIKTKGEFEIIQLIVCGAVQKMRIRTRS